ncbi:hypothetical protein FB451DRAFT_665433 [Mycena latifolia]|nr:hypothetical protein FB451DRAFT_665433 [Mycena latifolia]
MNLARFASALLPFWAFRRSILCVDEWLQDNGVFSGGVYKLRALFVPSTLHPSVPESLLRPRTLRYRDIAILAPHYQSHPIAQPQLIAHFTAPQWTHSTTPSSPPSSARLPPRQPPQQTPRPATPPMTRRRILAPPSTRTRRRTTAATV